MSKLLQKVIPKKISACATRSQTYIQDVPEMLSHHSFADITNLKLTYSKGVIGVLKGFQNG